MTAPTKKSMQRSPRGFTAVACYRPKHEVNVGGIWRTAFLYNASLLATVGRRYEKQASDTSNAAGHIPLCHYSDFDDLLEHLPHGCPIVGVELAENAVPLTKFWHPPSALYLMGAEDHGLPQKVLDRCHYVVQIPTAKEWSMNVATAAGIVLSHRYFQGLR